MATAFIVDACRTPRAIGKVGEGALAHFHPQHLGATVLEVIAERNSLDTADVDDIIWGTSSQRGSQGGVLGRMAALDQEEFPRGGTTMESLAKLKPVFSAWAALAVDESGTTYGDLMRVGKTSCVFVLADK